MKRKRPGFSPFCRETVSPVTSSFSHCPSPPSPKLASVALVTTPLPKYLFLLQILGEYRPWFSQCFACDAVDRPLLILPRFFSLVYLMFVSTHPGCQQDFQNELLTHLQEWPLETLESDFLCILRYLRLQANCPDPQWAKANSLFLLKQIIILTKHFPIAHSSPGKRYKNGFRFWLMPLPFPLYV